MEGTYTEKNLISFAENTEITASFIRDEAVDSRSEIDFNGKIIMLKTLFQGLAIAGLGPKNSFSSREMIASLIEGKTFEEALLAMKKVVQSRVHEISELRTSDYDRFLDIKEEPLEGVPDYVEIFEDEGFEAIEELSGVEGLGNPLDGSGLDGFY